MTLPTPDPAIGFHLRLLRLEAALAGAPPTIARVDATPSSLPGAVSDGGRGLSVQRRTLEIRDALERIPVRGDEALKRFILNCAASIAP